MTGVVYTRRKTQNGAPVISSLTDEELLYEKLLEAIKIITKHFGLARSIRIWFTLSTYRSVSALSAAGIEDSVIETMGGWKYLAFFIICLFGCRHLQSRTCRTQTYPPLPSITCADAFPAYVSTCYESTVFSEVSRCGSCWGITSLPTSLPTTRLRIWASWQAPTRRQFWLGFEIYA